MKTLHPELTTLIWTDWKVRKNSITYTEGTIATFRLTKLYGLQMKYLGGRARIDMCNRKWPSYEVMFFLMAYVSPALIVEQQDTIIELSFLEKFQSELYVIWGNKRHDYLSTYMQYLLK